MHRIESLMIVAEMAKVVYCLKGVKPDKGVSSSNKVLGMVKDMLAGMKGVKLTAKSLKFSSSAAPVHAKPPLHRSQNTNTKKKDRATRGAKLKRKSSPPKKNGTKRRKRETTTENNQ